jgi:hypothetical protein
MGAGLAEPGVSPSLSQLSTTYSVRRLDTAQSLDSPPRLTVNGKGRAPSGLEPQEHGLGNATLDIRITLYEYSPL